MSSVCAQHRRAQVAQGLLTQPLLPGAISRCCVCVLVQLLHAAFHMRVWSIYCHRVHVPWLDSCSTLHNASPCMLKGKEQGNKVGTMAIELM